MTPTVIPYNLFNVCEESVRIKKAQVYASQVVWNIAYQEESPLLIQTPWMMIPYHVVFKDDFKTFQFDCCQDDFCDKFTDLETHILQRIKKTHADVAAKKQLTVVKKYQSGKSLRVTGNTFDTSFFDQDGNGLDQDAKCLSQHKRVRMIICVRAAWSSSMYYGLDVTPLQVKVELPPRMPKDSFVDDAVIPNKYLKMRDMKIPVAAIANKMRLDGCDAEMVAMLGNDYSPPLKTTGPPVGFLNQITSGNFKLRNTKQDGRQQVMGKLSRFVDTSKHVPTLDDILCAKDRLKSAKQLDA